MTKKVVIAFASVVGVALVAAVAFYVNAYSETRHPVGPRVCECEILKEWIASLPLTPEADHLSTEEIYAEEDTLGFWATGGGLDGVNIERDALVDTLTSTGFNHDLFDTSEGWILRVYPGANSRQGSWAVELSATENGIAVGVRVSVDGSPWGLVYSEDLYDLYRNDRANALMVQQERQQQAIEVLQPFEEALEDLVVGG